MGDSGGEEHADRGLRKGERLTHAPGGRLAGILLLRSPSDFPPTYFARETTSPFCSAIDPRHSATQLFAVLLYLYVPMQSPAWLLAALIGHLGHAVYSFDSSSSRSESNVLRS